MHDSTHHARGPAVFVAAAAAAAVAAAIATGMDWRELETLIREERRSGNPVAGSIHSLQLDQNKITLLLINMLDTEEVWRGPCGVCVCVFGGANTHD